MRIADRLNRVQPSATLTITSRAAALKADGIDVIGFGAGQPDFATPAPIVAAAKRALDEGMTKYAPVPGLDSLRAAIAAHYQTRHGLETTAANVLVSVGGKHSLYNIAMALTQAGDRVLIPSPYWVSYPAQVLLADAEPVFVDAPEEDGFLLTPEGLDAAMREHTPRVIILNSPSNPTGAAYEPAQLKALLDVLRRYPDTFIVWDAIYERLVYDGLEYVEPATLAPDLRARIIVVNGFSKAYAMTGWRLGYAIAEPALIKAMSKLQSHTTSGATTFAQAAAVAALDLDDAVIDEMVKTFDGRRRRILELLRDIPDVTCPTPRGAFYAFPNFSAYLGARHGDAVIESDVDLATYLLEHGGVAIVPGSAFGAPGFARLSYATSLDDIEGGVARIRTALGALTRG